VFQDIEQTADILTNLIWIPSGCGRLASCLTANKHEDRARLIVPILIVYPISLLVSSGVLVIEVVNLACEIVLLEIFNLHFLVFFGE
jgi:hypothetical protein